MVEFVFFIGYNVTVMKIRHPIKKTIDDLEISGNITLRKTIVCVRIIVPLKQTFFSLQCCTATSQQRYIDIALQPCNTARLLQRSCNVAATKCAVWVHMYATGKEGVKHVEENRSRSGARVGSPSIFVRLYSPSYPSRSPSPFSRRDQ